MDTKKQKQTLVGLDEVADFCDLEHEVILRWNRDFGFPVEKIDGNIWTADPDAIVRWFKKRGMDPETARTSKLEKFETLSRQVLGLGEKHSRLLTGLDEIADFLSKHTQKTSAMQVHDYYKYYVDCPIFKAGKVSPHQVDADRLLAWHAGLLLRELFPNATGNLGGARDDI